MQSTRSNDNLSRGICYLTRCGGIGCKLGKVSCLQAEKTDIYLDSGYSQVGSDRVLSTSKASVILSR